MTSVYILWYTHELANKVVHRKLIGVYDSEANAYLAQERSLALPGFRDNPDGFTIDRYPLNHDNWEEGFSADIYKIRDETTK